MLDSLLSVLNSPMNRLYTDVVVVLYDSSRESILNKWSKQLLDTTDDCQMITVKKSKQIRSNKHDRYVLREELLNTLEAAHYEQVFVVLVHFLTLFDVQKPVLFALDVFEFCSAASYILWNDVSLYAISPRNENSQSVNTKGVFRCDIPSSDAFMVTMPTFSLLHHSPFDVSLGEWIVSNRIRRDRFTLTPAATRLFELHSPIPAIYVPFLEMDFRYLYQPNYDSDLQLRIRASKLVSSVSEIQLSGPGYYRLIYDNTRRETSIGTLISFFTNRSKSRGGYYSWTYRGIAIVNLGNVYVFLVSEVFQS